MTRKKLSENEAEFIKGSGAPPQPASSSQPKSKPINNDIMQILEPKQKPPKPATIRFTADLPEELHRRLTLAAAKAGKKKVDLVRELLDHILPSEQ